MPNELNDSAEPLSDDAYLERIDDRINWRLTHCNLPVADLKYLVNTVRALTERAERAEADARAWEHHFQHAVDTAVLVDVQVSALIARVTELEGCLSHIANDTADESTVYYRAVARDAIDGRLDVLAAVEEDLAAAEHRIEELTAERDDERAKNDRQFNVISSKDRDLAAYKSAHERDMEKVAEAESEVVDLSAQVEAYRSALKEIADNGLCGSEPDCDVYVHPFTCSTERAWVWCSSCLAGIALAALSDKEEEK